MLVYKTHNFDIAQVFCVRLLKFPTHLKNFIAGPVLPLLILCKKKRSPSQQLSCCFLPGKVECLALINYLFNSHSEFALRFAG